MNIFFKKSVWSKKKLATLDSKQEVFLTSSFFGTLSKTDMDLINNIYIFKITFLTPFSLLKKMYKFR